MASLMLVILGLLPLLHMGLTGEPDPVIIKSSPYSRHMYSYNLQWERPETGRFPIREYQLKYRQVTLKSGTLQPEAEHPITDFTAIRLEDNPYNPRQSYEFTNLGHGSYYEVEVRARNDIGWSSPTSFVFTTVHATPTYPANITLLEVGSTTAVLSVDPPINQGASPIQGYQVQYDNEILLFPGDHANEELRIEGLQPTTEYDFFVSAYNEYGAGFSIWHWVKTGEINLPGRPHVTVLEDGTTSAVLSVEPPEDEGASPILGYQVKFYDWSRDRTEVFAPGEEIRIENLEPSEWYHMEVAAMNAFGVGLNNWITVYTQSVGE